ncbi:glycoside hydrolase family 15 protein [Streptomyces sp. OF3]|uniref:Trehalase n=1 Tax=Streptomyces alkaliterrae TaxID=2213162 RepID=A0A7W3WKG2_9ACTN|nr:glycoside hydrolase family 15 protein [Streptomyces alkaliterrae]MBB1254027.1 glycoside hydrolase family 15 protein [Streptomyces alkaliterrae]
MSIPLEDYAMIGDTRTAALVSRSGDVDWLCLPRFDSPACFAALLGGPEHGCWSLAPRGEGWRATRRYVGDSLVLETVFEGPDGGSVRVVDCMPVRRHWPDLIRRVEGVTGRVSVRGLFTPRFDYGSTVPWFRHDGRRLHAVAGPDHLVLGCDLGLAPPRDGEDHVVTDFDVSPGEIVEFHLGWTTSERRDLPLDEPRDAVERTREWWREWAGRHRYQGRYDQAVTRSLLTLKGLTYAPTGGIVAAPTTSLPEKLGGVRNWDYRFCWIRDATFVLLALLDAGYREEARDWREWLLRAVAGTPEQMQIMYGVDGTRRLPETELDWLPGYAGSRPVHTGNEATNQFQTDVYGEVMEAMHLARLEGIPPDEDAWRLQRALMDFLESHWQDPDNGIWEVRGPRRHFTHSKMMAWAAADRAVRAIEDISLDGPLDRWRRLRQEIRDEVCKKGYDPERETFTQYYGSRSLDASMLMAPEIGFLPADDPRMRGTVRAVERELTTDGLVMRYTMDKHTEQVDGLPEGEGAFLACTFWLADCYVLRGDVERGREVFEHLLDLRNDVGLLAEQYDPAAGRLMGNFPQALSHIPMVNTAFRLAEHDGEAGQRAARSRKRPEA